MSILCSELSELVDLALNREWRAFYMYETFANKFNVLGFNGFANYFKNQAREEQRHIKTLTDYIVNTRGRQPRMFPIEPPPQEFETSFLECLKTALEFENFITMCAKNVIEQCVIFGDKHLEAFFVDFILTEQYNCMKELENTISILSQMGNDPYRIWMFNNHI